MKSNDNPDTVVIGAGPGGYTAAIRLGQYGLSPTVVEKENVGGVCLNWGCIPTKTLYSSTEPLAKKSSWGKRGIDIEGLDVDLEKIFSYQRKVVNKLTDGVGKLIESNGGEVIEGKAKLSQGPAVTVEKDSGDEITFQPENVILAPGSSPIELPGFSFDNDDVWDSRDAIRLDEVPEKLVILGAGVIGLEMGTVYSRLGSEVEIVEMKEAVLPGVGLERRFSSFMKRGLKQAGITVHTETKAVEIQENSDGKVVIAEKDGEREKFPADKVLSAVGRRPNLDFSTEGIDIPTDDSGYVKTDERCMTDLDGVYAIGDVAGLPLLAHKASREGLMAAASIAGKEVSNFSTIPAVVFTDPEYAEVGLSTEEARERDFEPAVGRFPFRASGKALAMDETEGMVQLVAEKETDRLLGGAILGPGASDLIAEIGLAVEQGLTATQVAETIHPHPTLSEAIMEAAESVHGQAIHTSNR